jgi:hypothetical protein
MVKIIPFKGLVALGFAWIGAVVPVRAQMVNRESVDALLVEGEVDKAEKALASYWKAPELTYPDSIYILKNLGVLYSSLPKKKEQGDKLFQRLLELDPFASIHDTYASNSILARFKKIKKAYQIQKGGRALIPSVAVFDFHGGGLNSQDGAAMAQQFIAEMQRMDIFHTLDRSNVTETMDKMRMTPDKCLEKECRLDISRRLTAEKMVTVEMAKVDSVYTFTLAYTDVDSGLTSTILRKVFKKKLERLLAEGFGEMATELQDREAAWLNLTVNPTNTILTIDASPMAAIASKVPLNPGKHQVCGSSPGYATVCKDFEVKRNDAVTYALSLPIKGDGLVRNRKRPQDEDDEEESDEPPPETEAGSTSHGFIWMTVGSMAVLAVALAVMFNTRN